MYKITFSGTDIGHYWSHKLKQKPTKIANRKKRKIYTKVRFSKKWFLVSPQKIFYIGKATNTKTKKMNILNAHEIKIHVELNFSRQICGTIRNNDNDYANDNDKDIIKKYNITMTAEIL